MHAIIDWTNWGPSFNPTILQIVCLLVSRDSWWTIDLILRKLCTDRSIIITNFADQLGWTQKKVFSIFNYFIKKSFLFFREHSNLNEYFSFIQNFCKPFHRRFSEYNKGIGYRHIIRLHTLEELNKYNENRWMK